MVVHTKRWDRLLQWLLLWTALTTIVFWLPALRGLFDGESYAWNNFGFRGRGVSGDYWFVASATLLALAAQYLASRGPRAPFYVLFGGWHVFLAFGALSIAINDPEALRFRGDTLGINVSLAVAGPLIFGAGALLALSWMVHDARHARATPALSAWSKRNTLWTLGLAAVLPILFVLLRFGEPDGTMDKIGVLLAIGQWLMMSVGLQPDSVTEVAAARARTS
jgi:hypothetical protein